MMKPRIFRRAKPAPGVLTREEEHDLTTRFWKTRDRRLSDRIVVANLRLVKKIAFEYRNAGANLDDLVQEGNLGLIHAVEKFDPTRGVKLSSYAAWWIRAYILKAIIANWRLVKLGTTRDERKLFYNLQREREKLEAQGIEVEPRHLAAVLGVSEETVTDMQGRLHARDLSIDRPLFEQDGKTIGDLLPSAHPRADTLLEMSEIDTHVRRKVDDFAQKLNPKHRAILYDRLLGGDDRCTLQEIADRFGLTRERARQIQVIVMNRLRKHLADEEELLAA